MIPQTDLLISMQLRDALQDAITGLQWRIENQPTACDNSDYEKVDEWQKLLEQANEIVPIMRRCETCGNDNLHTYLPLEGWQCCECDSEDMADFYAEMMSEDEESEDPGEWGGPFRAIELDNPQGDVYLFYCVGEKKQQLYLCDNLEDAYELAENLNDILNAIKIDSTPKEVEGNVNFNNLRLRALRTWERLIKELNSHIVKENPVRVAGLQESTHPWGQHSNLNIQGFLLIDADEIQDMMDTMRDTIGGIAMVYEGDRKDFVDVFAQEFPGDEDRMTEFNPKPEDK